MTMNTGEGTGDRAAGEPRYGYGNERVVPFLEYFRSKVRADIRKGKRDKAELRFVAQRAASRDADALDRDTYRTASRDIHKYRKWRRGNLLWLAMISGKTYTEVEQCKQKRKLPEDTWLLHMTNMLWLSIGLPRFNACPRTQILE